MTQKLLHRYRSPTLVVDDFACTASRHACSGEEAALADEIAIVRSGLFEKCGPDGRYLIDPTQVVLFRRGEPYVIQHPGDDGDYCTVLTFAPASLLDAFASTAANPGSPLRSMPTALSLGAPLLLSFRWLLTALREYPDDALLIDELSLLALSALRDAASCPGEPARPDTICDPAVAAVRTVLAERFSERLTIPDLAQELGVSTFQLCRRFRRLTGGTIHGHVTALRMAAALERIGDYRRDLSRLACELGYSSHSHFTTVFSSFFSVTPSEVAKGERISALRKNLKAARPQLQ